MRDNLVRAQHIHSAAKHRSADVKDAAIDAMRAAAHVSSEPELVVLARDETEKSVRIAALQVLSESPALQQSTVEQLLNMWDSRPSHTIGRCTRTCVQAACHPHVHTDQCRETCHQQCKEQRLVFGELHALLRKHLPGRPKATTSGKAMAAMSSSSRGRELQIIDWHTVDFNKFTLTFVDLNVQFQPKINQEHDLGFRLGSGDSDIGFFGFKTHLVVDNSAWLRIGLFDGGFGVRDWVRTHDAGARCPDPC